MAGALIGALRVTLGMDSAAFEKGASEAARRMNGLTRSLEKTGDKFKSIGAGLSLGITAPLALFGKGAFDAATDAGELQSAFDTTFGNMSDTMNKWAVATGDALGRSTQEMQKAANTFGIFFNQAVDPAKAAQMSQTFAKLAQDLGSFYNTDTQTAIEKLRSGLSGESEPLRDFGVFLTEAAVKAKAMELGLTGVGNELTEQEKIVARYALILEQTKNAQGDVERTSAGTANQLRAAQAAFDELQVVVGTKLLPVLTPLVTKLAEALNWFTSLPAPVQTAGVALGAVAAGLGPLALGLGSVINAGATLLPGFIKIAGFFSGTLVPVLATVGRALIGLAIAGGPLTILAAAAVAVYVAWQNWDKIGPIVGRMVTAVKTWLVDKLGAVFNWVQGKVKAVGDWFFQLYDRVVGHSYVPDMVDGIATQFDRLDGVMVEPTRQATGAADDAFETTGAAGETMAERIGNMAQSVGGALRGLADSIRNGDFFDIMESVLDVIGQIANSGIFGGGKVETPSASGHEGAHLPGFATGGSFKVGGVSGIDKNVVAFRATRGEMVDIRRPGQAMAGGGVATVRIVEDSGFAARVVGISGNVSVETQRQSQRRAAMRGRQRY